MEAQGCGGAALSGEGISGSSELEWAGQGRALEPQEFWVEEGEAGMAAGGWALSAVCGAIARSNALIPALSGFDARSSPKAWAPSHGDFLPLSGGLLTRTHLHTYPWEQLPTPRYPSGPHGLSPVTPCMARPPFLPAPHCAPTWVLRCAPGDCRGC